MNTTHTHTHGYIIYRDKVRCVHGAVVSAGILLETRNRNSSIMVADVSCNINVPNSAALAAKTANCASIDNDIRVLALDGNIGVDSCRDSADLKKNVIPISIKGG